MMRAVWQTVGVSGTILRSVYALTWSFEQLAISRPSSEGSTQRTQSLCPVIVRTRCLQWTNMGQIYAAARAKRTDVDATSHIRIVRSRLALTIC